MYRRQQTVHIRSNITISEHNYANIMEFMTKLRQIFPSVTLTSSGVLDIRSNNIGNKNDTISQQLHQLASRYRIQIKHIRVQNATMAQVNYCCSISVILFISTLQIITDIVQKQR
jgi:hypothetical protein